MKLTAEQRKKWLMNGLKFVAPTLAILFYQLAQGADLKVALPLALFAFYQSISDYFGKLGSQK
jgi:hypothetical protein